MKFFNLDIIMFYIFRKRFKPEYFVWTDQGEVDGLNDIYFIICCLWINIIGLHMIKIVFNMIGCIKCPMMLSGYNME